MKSECDILNFEKYLIFKIVITKINKNFIKSKFKNSEIQNTYIMFHVSNKHFYLFVIIYKTC